MAGPRRRLASVSAELWGMLAMEWKNWKCCSWGWCGHSFPVLPVLPLFLWYSVNFAYRLGELYGTFFSMIWIVEGKKWFKWPYLPKWCLHYEFSSWTLLCFLQIKTSLPWTLIVISYKFTIMPAYWLWRSGSIYFWAIGYTKGKKVIFSQFFAGYWYCWCCCHGDLSWHILKHG